MVPQLLVGPSRTEVVVDERATPRITATPGFIDQIAVPEDGGVAVTLDGLGAVRVWPALDGTREPIVLAMRRPKAVALARDGADLAIAGVDALGQLELVRATADGDPRRRIEIAIERPVVAIRATSSGFLALRDDRVIAFVDLDGTLRGELAPNPGEYLASITVRHDGALALVESERGVHGRWIDLATRTWGASTAKLPIDPHEVILSPNHERIAARNKSGIAFSVVRLSDGKVLSTEEDSIEDSEPLSRPIGFITDRTIGFANENRAWWAGDEYIELTRGHGFQAFDGGIIGGATSALVITTAKATWYVGYRLTVPNDFRATSSGFLATDGRRIVELDQRFRTRAAYDATAESIDMYRIVFASDHHAIGFSYSKNRTLYLMATELSSTSSIASGVSDWGFERSTGLLYYLTDHGVFARQFDRKAGAFGPEVRVSTTVRSTVLLDADQGRDKQIALIDSGGSGQSIIVTYGHIVDGEFVDTGQKIFNPSQEWWNTVADPPQLVRPPGSRARSPDRKLVAEVRDQRLTLRAGKDVKWTVPSVGVYSVAWTPKNELVVYGGGMATVDLETGALRDRQCGSWFGRWDTAPDIFGSAELCEVTP